MSPHSNSLFFAGLIYSKQEFTVAVILVLIVWIVLVGVIVYLLYHYRWVPCIYYIYIATLLETCNIYDELPGTAHAHDMALYMKYGVVHRKYSHMNFYNFTSSTIFKQFLYCYINSLEVSIPFYFHHNDFKNYLTCHPNSAGQF